MLPWSSVSIRNERSVKKKNKEKNNEKNKEKNKEKETAMSARKARKGGENKKQATSGKK